MVKIIAITTEWTSRGYRHASLTLKNDVIGKLYFRVHCVCLPPHVHPAEIQEAIHQSSGGASAVRGVSGSRMFVLTPQVCVHFSDGAVFA